MSRFEISSGVAVGEDAPLLVIAGPCALESPETAMLVAREAAAACRDVGFGYIFKASFDKANRTSSGSFRGRGLDDGLRILRNVGDELGVPLTTDIHDPDQAPTVGEVVDLIQIPALLCRQTSLLEAAARTGKAVNVKKGQFMAPWDMAHVVDKIRGAGGQRILVTERGSMFGYNNLVVDLRSLLHMRALGVPLVFDATHSVQAPGGRGYESGGQGEHAPHLARAAAAVGIDALFLETHPNPRDALSDGPVMLPLNDLHELLLSIRNVRASLTR